MWFGYSPGRFRIHFSNWKSFAEGNGWNQKSLDGHPFIHSSRILLLSPGKPSHMNLSILHLFRMLRSLNVQAVIKLTQESATGQGLLLLFSLQARLKRIVQFVMEPPTNTSSRMEKKLFQNVSRIVLFLSLQLTMSSRKWFES